MHLPRIWKRCASAFVRNCEDFGQRLSPSWRGAWSRRAGHAVGRAGRPCRGRCKYVHVSSVAASMRLTPLHGLPTLPSTVSCGRPPRMKERRAKRVARFACSERSMAPLYRRQCTIKQKGRGEGRVLFLFFQFVSNPCSCPPSPGNCRGRGGVVRICQRWGGVGMQDRWRHPWRHRAPMDGFTACPAQPHRPAIPRNTSFGCCFGCCCCLNASAGAGSSPAEQPFT